MKEKLKGENDELKKIKHKLKDVQEKQKAEKEVSQSYVETPHPTPPRIRSVLIRHFVATKTEVKCN